MSVFKRFEPTDFIHSVLLTSPQLDLASGSAGWRGGPSPSASVSLLDGLRARNTTGAAVSMRPVFHRDQNPALGGPVDVALSYPLSASVKYVCARPEPNSANDGTNWGEEHWDVLGPLYDWHSRYNAEYHTASYDFYSLFSALGSTNVASRTGSVAASSVWNNMSSSFTMEFMVKPLSVTSKLQDFTLFSRTGHCYLGITGSTGRLVFSGSFMGSFTSSRGPDVDRWSHVVVRGQAGAGSFLIDLVDAGTFTYTGSMVTTSPVMPAPALGNVFVSPTALGGTVESGSDASAIGSVNRSFHGLFGDVRFWSTRRSGAQLSASFNQTMFTTGSQTGLVAYYRMNQGPLFRSDSDNALYSLGSGVLDYSGNQQHLSLRSFSSRRGPVWLPNDNAEFYTSRTLAAQSSSVPILRIINVPSLMYGRQIATGSVSLTCRAYSSGSIGLVRTLVDDGRGGLYVSGSMTSSSLETKESYDGVRFNRVGNVFYGEGLIVIRDPSLFDFGAPDGILTTTSHPSDLLSVSFRGESSIPSNVVMCRADAGEMNVSNNPTFSTVDPISGKPLIDPEAPTYVTAVGLYDAQRRLVAVAKLAQPIRKRLRDKLCVRLRYDR